MSDFVIREAQKSDLPRLGERFGGEYFHRERFGRQAAGRATYLLAEVAGKVVAGEVVAHLLIRWPGPDNLETRRRLHNAPEINALHVHASRQGEGIGSDLIAYAQDLARSRGYDRLCIGVETVNVRAQSLYERLGYELWSYGETVDRWTELDEFGNEVVKEAITVYLSRSLAPLDQRSSVRDSLS